MLKHDKALKLYKKKIRLGGAWKTTSVYVCVSPVFA